MTEPTQSAEGVVYPCTFPETNHEALMSNLYAVVEQRDEARDVLRRLLVHQDEWATHGDVCDCCPCETCEDWLDRESILWAQTRKFLARIDGSGCATGE